MCHGTMTQPIVEKAFSRSKVAEITTTFGLDLCAMRPTKGRAARKKKTNEPTEIRVNVINYGA